MIRSFGLNDFLFLLEAAQWTLALTLIALVGGGLAGFAIALLRVGRSGWARGAALVYIQVVQGTPVLMLLFLSYYGLSLAGLELPPLVAAGLSMSIYASAYLGEIWRGAIQSVPRQQWEASACLAMTRLPAVPLRHPAAGGAHLVAADRSGSWCSSSRTRRSPRSSASSSWPGPGS